MYEVITLGIEFHFDNPPIALKFAIHCHFEFFANPIPPFPKPINPRKINT